MKRKSLQEIEDYYKNKSYGENKLKKVLSKDKEWVRLYKKRKQKLTKSFPLTKTEQRKYVMSTNKDYEILKKIKQLKKLKLTKKDKVLIDLIKTQLEYEWRKYLIQILNLLLKRYSKK